MAKQLKYIFFLVPIIFMGTNTDLSAQPLFGYQTNGVHTFYFSVSWNGKPNLGAGYILRRYGDSFTDWNAEWRFPVDGMYKLDNHQVIIGMYRPSRLKRSFVGLGVHAKITKQTFGSKKITHYGLGLTVLPSYVYSASLTDGLYGTAGIMLNYEPILLTQIKEGDGKAEIKPLTGHKVRLGGHLDFHTQRTLGATFNGFMTNTFTKESELFTPEEQDWNFNGELYMGTTYYLKRAF